MIDHEYDAARYQAILDEFDIRHGCVATFVRALAAERDEALYRLKIARGAAADLAHEAAVLQLRIDRAIEVLRGTVSYPSSYGRRQVLGILEGPVELEA